MHILFVCRFLPHSQARDSGRLDTFNYIKSLSEKNLVSLIAFVSTEDEKGIGELQNLCEQVVCVRYNHSGLVPRLKRAWWRIWLPKVYGRNQSSSYKNALKTIIKQHHYDIAVVDGMMASYSCYLDHLPHVLDEVDLFFMVAHQIFQNESNPISRMWLKFDWLRTMAWESDYIKLCQGVFVRSTKDKILIDDLHPQQKVCILSPWFEGLDELQGIPINRPAENNLLFVGAMNIPANIEAVTYFVSQVLPLVRAHILDTRLYIVGSNPTPSVQALAQYPGVIVTGEVPSLFPYYKLATIIVVPLFTGGGIIVKTLNGLASGRPVITTSIGLSGTGAQHGRDLWVSLPTPDAMAADICCLLKDLEQWYTLANHGREFIQTQFAWQQTTEQMSRFLGDIALQNKD